MTPHDARAYLVSLAATPPGRAILGDLGYDASTPASALDDPLSVIIAAAALREWYRRYPWTSR